jgi:hypothetical protein
MLGEGVCAGLGGTHAAFVGGSEACIGKRDEPDEVTSLLYRNEYYIETILSTRFWGEHSLLLFHLMAHLIIHFKGVIYIELSMSIIN